ncbi:putative GPI anchored cell wall protein [Hyaloscypha sp. PMI_1271]|nr:putative GPI anchored cell wall protein [Hyaloscypha sp. PMI_1271]
MNTFAALSLILGASAFAVPRSSCSFQLTASGGESGTIGQLSDGQNRIGGGLSPATFAINNGGIIDSASRGCILTPSVEQFQCDQGVGPTFGFAIDSNETLTYSGSSVFYACPASDTEWNLYTTPVTGQEKCVEISLTASGCGAATSVASSVTTVTVYDCGMASSTSPLATSTPVVVQSSTSLAPVVQYSPSTASIPAASPSTSPLGSVPSFPSSSEQYSRGTTVIPTPIDTTSVWAHTYVSSAPETIVTYTSSVATSVQSSSTCVTTSLTGSSTPGNYQYPHLIVPISSSSPTAASGTSYFGTISSNTSTIFNFDIPSSYSGSTCNLIFLLPLLSELETSSYTFSGSGGVDFSQLSSAATEATTWDNAPSVEKDLGEFTLSEGSSTLVESFVCPAGETLSFEMSAVGDTFLYFFQDWNPSPLGLYITVC